MIRKKLASKGGFTLTEMIVTLAVMALVGIAVSVGITTAAKAYTDITLSSEASVLCGTIAIELTDELRFASNITVEENITTKETELTFDSPRFGPGVGVGDNDGYITVGGHLILPEKAYTNNLRAYADVSYTKGGVFSVEIRITSAGGTLLERAEFSITPVSG